MAVLSEVTKEVVYESERRCKKVEEGVRRWKKVKVEVEVEGV